MLGLVLVVLVLAAYLSPLLLVSVRYPRWKDSAIRKARGQVRGISG